MNTTDASVCPYPAGDSSIRRMAIEAAELGFDSIVAIGGEHGAAGEFRILTGAVIDARSAKDVLRQVRNVSRNVDLTFVNAGDLAFNRAAVTTGDVQIIRHIHTTHRNSFDHVAARSATERGVAVDISLYPIVHWRGARRQKALQRYADLLSLHRRYRFPLTISSNARSILDQRSVRDVEQLCALFGMTRQEVRTALGTVHRILEHKQPVRVIG